LAGVQPNEEERLGLVESKAMVFKPTKRRIIVRYFLLSLVAIPLLGILNVVKPMPANWFISALEVVAITTLGAGFWSFSSNTTTL